MSINDKKTHPPNWHYFLQDKMPLSLEEDLKLSSKEAIFTALISLFKNRDEKLKEFIMTHFESFSQLLCAQKQDWDTYSDKNFFIFIELIKEAALRYNRSYFLSDYPLDDDQKILDYLISQVAREPVEQFRILFFDKKKKFILDEIQAKGTINHTYIYPREITKRCLELNATFIILVHNHPSGDATPSPYDVKTTQQIQRALKTFGISIFDHYIISRNQQTSLKKIGLFP